MPNYNLVILMGHLTRDPELKQVAGTSVCEFTIAVSEKWTTESGEKRERTSFVECAMWGKRGELFREWHSKGQAVFVEGKLDQQTWDDRETGQRRSKLIVKVSEFQNASGKREDREERPRATRVPQQARPPRNADLDPDDQDTPF